MDDTGVVDLDADVVVVKSGRGRPRGSKNKPKVISMAASSSMPIKWRCGHPLRSKNKPRSSTSQINEPLDVSAAPLNPSLPSTGTVFSFFAIACAQCREQHGMPLKFTEFMDGQELRKAILREVLGEGSPYEVEVY
jgi:hypothetical protein